MKLRSALVALAIAVLAVAGPAAASAPAAEKPAAKFEVKFLTDMIHHHHMAVEMSEICMENATHEELRALCESIAESQMGEIDMMAMWLHHWYGLEHPMMTMNPGQMRQMDKLAALSGADFEISFMESMIRHHHGALVEGSKCLKQAEHAPLLDLCGDIISTQSEEIELMQTWLCDWYGRCRGPHS